MCPQPYSSGVNASSKLKAVGLGRGCFPPHEGVVSGGGNLLFCDLKMAYIGEFCGTEFKTLYRELPQ